MDFLSSKKPIYVGVVVLLTLVLGYYLFIVVPAKPSTQGEENVSGETRATSSTATSTTTTVNGVTITGSGGVTIKTLPDAAIPDLDRAINPQGLTPEIAKLYSDRIKETSSALKKDPILFDSWISLGTLRKGIGDYEGARVVWEYASILAPTNTISFNNLGDLYHYYLKQYEKAEFNFKIAIKNAPSSVFGYQGLFDLYRYSYKTTTSAAVDILKAGIKQIPETIDLRVSLASYYKAKGDTANAKVYFEEALQKAKDQNNNTLAGMIEAELKNL